MLFSWVLKQEFSYLSEVGASCLLNFGEKHIYHQIGKTTELNQHSKSIKTIDM